MNFLAHLYLSGQCDSVKLGNFIGDFVKGNKHENFPSGIQRGIILHRHIDHYTDIHPLVSKSAQRLRYGYNRYSPVVVDMFYDHFLAKNWDNYHTLTLREYTNSIHHLLIRNYGWLPQPVKRFLPFLMASRRLESYASINGLQRALEIMSRRTSLPNKTQWAIHCLETNYDDFEQDFTNFFPEVIHYVETQHNVSVEAPDDLRLNVKK